MAQQEQQDMPNIPGLDLTSQPTPQRKGFGLGSILVLIGVIVIAGIIGLAYLRQQQAQPTSGPAPDFTFTTFDGQSASLSSLEGNIVVLNFWASWCEPCGRESPALESLWQRYKDRGVVVLGIAYADIDADSLRFINTYGLTYPNAPDAATRITAHYNVRAVPETFIIDQSGNIIKTFFAEVTEQEIVEVIDPILENEL